MLNCGNFLDFNIYIDYCKTTHASTSRNGTIRHSKNTISIPKKYKIKMTAFKINAKLN